MKPITILSFVLTILLLGCNHNKTYKSEKSDFSEELKWSNNLIERSLLNKNVDSIMVLYKDELTFMPEHKSAIFSKANLDKFYRKWIDSTDIVSYKKNIFEIKVIDGRLLEIGTFSMKYRKQQDSIKTYNGKYMIVWEDQGNGNFKIMSEIFGSDVFIRPEDMPYSNVTVNDSSDKKPVVDEDLKNEILKVNEGVIQAVEKGDGNARANGFTSDGIYMPHYGKMLVGMDSIKPYMLKIYQPEASLYVTHTYYDIYDFKDYVLVNGHFKGGWGDSINGGTFEGNMSNLRKRTENGQLLMYRQLTSDD